MKKAEIVKLLQRMSDNEMDMHTIYKAEGNEIAAERCIAASIAFDSAIWLLTDKQYAADIAAIYKITD